MQRRLGQAPIRFARPARVLELVLHVEQPDADGRGEHKDRPWIIRNAPGRRATSARRRPTRFRIGRHRRIPRRPARAHQAQWRAMLHQEQVGRPDAEHHDRMAIEAVAEPPAPVQLKVLVDRQRIDVAEAAMIEVAGAGVVSGVGSLPVIVRRESQHAERAPDQSLIARWRKNEPWPQSCWIMNSRTRNPAAGRARMRLSQ